MTETALIIPVPEAEPLVGAYRDELDRSAAWNIPAHVTVLVPFLPLDRIDQDALRELFAAEPAFEATFTAIDWFGDQVVFVRPAPDDRFRGLTEKVRARFPDAPPYGGRFDDVVPHLTVGEQSATAPLTRLQAAADAVAAGLPFTAPIRSVRLVEGETGVTPYRPIADFPLGAATR